ncbi:MAG: FixH family protein [Gammaproteobacteria bacterium]
MSITSMTTEQPDSGAPRWYRDPFRWLVVGPPLAAVLAGGVTLWLAIDSYDGLVVDDYYKRGLEINQVLARDERAAALALAATVDWEAAPGGEGTLQVRWQGGDTAVAPPSLDLKLIYATRAGFDRDVRAVRVDAHHYAARMPALRTGEWHVHIAADDWRLTETMWVP